VTNRHLLYISCKNKYPDARCIYKCFSIKLRTILIVRSVPVPTPEVRVKYRSWIFAAGISIIFSGSLQAAENVTELQKQDILNILGCTNQWDFTVYVHSMRLRGLTADAATAELIKLWDAPDNEGYSKLIRGSIDDAVEFVYAEKDKAKTFANIVSSADNGMTSCIGRKNLTLYRRELTQASKKAGLATLWDYHRRKGIKKEQILASSKKMSEGGRKILDEVYADKFDIRLYRIRQVWNPTTDYISRKYHGRIIRR
jgi:hypothetical protein